MTEAGTTPETRPRGPRNLALRRRTTADVLTRCQEMRELEDGFELTFPNNATWQEKVHYFADAWQQSCPHMSFQVTREEPGQPLVLSIRGPDGTKQFIDGARYMLTSHLNPAPTFRHKAAHAARFATSPLRVLPDFLILGAKKCGTTALYSYMTGHPKIAPAFRKEIYFFNGSFHKGRHWYRAFFPLRSHMQPGMVTGEATPDYLFDLHSPERIHRTLPNARLIAILRNPIDRAYSFYNHNLRSGLEEESFEAALDLEEERLAGEEERMRANPEAASFLRENYSYKLRGYYVDQLEEYTRRFAKEQLLVLKTEDLYHEPSRTLGDALRFLGLDHWEPAEFKKLNAAPYPDLDPKVRDRLRGVFEPSNQRLYEFLGRDLGWQ